MLGMLGEQRAQLPDGRVELRPAEVEHRVVVLFLGRGHPTSAPPKGRCCNALVRPFVEVHVSSQPSMQIATPRASQKPRVTMTSPTNRWRSRQRLGSGRSISTARFRKKKRAFSG